jgi:hypothetical protein
MEILKAGNLAVRFLLELCLLAALVYWGFQSGQGWLGKMSYGIGAPLLAAVIWGMFVAPKARYQLPGGMILALELILFAAGVTALYAAHQATLAWSLGLVYAANRLLIYLWHQ